MTWWQITLAALAGLLAVNVLFVLWCLSVARHDKVLRDVTRDDVSGLHVFDDDDFFEERD